MDRREEFLTTARPGLTSEGQPDLFDLVSGMEPEYLAANAPDLDLEETLRAMIGHCLRIAKKHGLSRERLVERINLCLPEREAPITLRQLNGWTARSAENRPFPAWVLPAFIWACRGTYAPLELLANAIGLRLLDEQEAAAAELGEAIVTKSRAMRIERTLRAKLGG